jgi:hypothetical protein
MSLCTPWNITPQTIAGLGFGLWLVTGLGCGEQVATPESLAGLAQAVIVSSISEGDYVIRSAATNKCIDVSGASRDEGAKVQEWDCNGTVAQTFHISPVGGGYWKIINVNSGKGLDIKDASPAANAVVQQGSYGGGANQQFRFVARGGNQFSFHPRHTDRSRRSGAGTRRGWPHDLSQPASRGWLHLLSAWQLSQRSRLGLQDPAHPGFTA